MASLQQIKKGWQTGYRLQVCASGKRHSVWLGNVRKREAETVQLHVEAIIQSQRLQTPLPSETQRWLRDLTSELRQRLTPILGTAKSVDEAADLYVAHCEATFKITTARTNADTVNQFASFCGSTSMRSITGEQIDTWLIRQNVASSTIGKHVKNLRAWLAWCVRESIIDTAPRIETPSTTTSGDKKYLELAKFEAIIGHFEGNPEMQCALALSRWCGLRMASEICPLLRSNVDVANERIIIEDTKRSHQQSRGPPRLRKLPLFTGLRPYLMPMLDRAGNPNDYLLPTIGGQDPNRVGSLIRQRVYRAIERLGLERWPRVFNSVRATRQTQLKDLFGEKVACDWIGNTTEVFRRHYELIDEKVFAQAVDS